MPQFIIQCWDKPQAQELRAATRPAHLDYVNSGAVKLIAVGPMLTEEGQPFGSLLIIETQDRDAAERFAAEDPYAKAGLFQRVEVTAWRQVFPAT